MHILSILIGEDLKRHSCEPSHEKTCLRGLRQGPSMATGLKFRNFEVEELYYVAKTKARISCIVTAQLICVFVFAYAKNTRGYQNVRALIGGIEGIKDEPHSDWSFCIKWHNMAELAHERHCPICGNVNGLKVFKPYELMFTENI